MSSPAPRSNTLTLTPNVAVECVLKYQTGRQCSNGRILFTLISGEQLYLDANDARKIHELGLGINEPFRIMKRVANSETSIIVSRSGQQPGRSFDTTNPAAAATPESANQRIAQSSQGNVTSVSIPNTTMAHALASAYISAIDGLIIAQEYAKAKGFPFRADEETIHTSAHAVFIEFGKAKERAIREREYEARYGYQQSQPMNGGASWPQH